MARVTVEDCIKRIENRFDLVIAAADRTRQIAQGAEITIERDNDKNTVVSLREIAQDMLDLEELRKSSIKKYQLVPEVGSDDDIEIKDLMKQEQNWLSGTENLEMKQEIQDDHLSIISEESIQPQDNSEVFEDVSEAVSLNS